jgi:hypothetical protein
MRVARWRFRQRLRRSDDCKCGARSRRDRSRRLVVSFENDVVVAKALEFCEAHFLDVRRLDAALSGRRCSNEQIT